MIFIRQKYKYLSNFAFMPESCFHCGQPCDTDRIVSDQKSFCCNGCKTVYEILNQNDLTDFYELNKAPGIQPDKKSSLHFEFLDTPAVFDKVVDFSEDGTTVVTFHVPVIHCSSCVWVLESLHEIHPAITQSVVNFARRRVQVTYKSDQMKLSEVAQFMAQLGYKPVINLESAEKTEHKEDRKLILQLVVAGFCFGNIMLFAFPEYVDNGDSWLSRNNVYMRWFTFALSLPVVFYSAQPYLISAYRAIRSRIINIDIPIAVGILVLFLRSTYEIAADLSSGYFDSLAGLVFFMLIGRWFQRRTYQSLAFDRDYKSFYPIAVTKVLPEGNQNILLSDLKKGDRILLRDEEILPADAVLMKGEARIDNSFVTGESRLITKNQGDRIFAGGKHTGAAVELEIIEEVNQSYLTSLWNSEAFSKNETEFDTIINRVSRWFVWIVLAIALVSAVYWYFTDVSRMFQVITAILIIACPCALGLSAPFTLGNVMRIMGRKGFYVKDTHTIENMAKTDTIVFDKTGTITESNATSVSFEGGILSEDEKDMIYTLVSQSNHPLSRSIEQYLKIGTVLEINDYQQLKGRGQEAEINGQHIQLGSKDWLGIQHETELNQTEVWVKINGMTKGRFVFQNKYRQGLKVSVEEISDHDLHILSGDNDSEEANLKTIFPQKTVYSFNSSPQDKLEYIRKLQTTENKNVMMVGDGLNDAGALKQSLVGIAVAEDMNSFSPSCDAILGSGSFHLLPKFLQLSKKGVNLVKTAFVISFLYNIIGLSFAVTGNLEPVVAAILMPVSSVSVVLFASLSSWLSAYFIFKEK